MEPIALPANEAFAAIGVGKTTGYRLVSSGELELFKIGRASRITTASIKAYVAKRVAEKAAA